MAWWNRSYVCCIWYMDSFSQWSHLLLTMSRTVGIIILILESLRNLLGGFPGATSGKESICQCRRLKRLMFDPWVGKIPWRRKWLPTPVFLPRKFHGQRSLVDYSSRGHKELDMTEWLILSLFFSIRCLIWSFFFPSNCCHWLIGNFMPFFACF